MSYQDKTKKVIAALTRPAAVGKTEAVVDVSEYVAGVKLPELPPIPAGELYQAVVIDGGDCTAEFVGYVQDYARQAVTQAVAAKEAELAALREAVRGLEAKCRHHALTCSNLLNDDSSGIIYGWCADELAAITNKD